MLEVGTAREDFVDEVLHADNAVLSEALLDDGVVGEGNALGEAGTSSLDLAVATLVDELADGLQVGVTVGNVWLDDLEHLQSSLGKLDEDTVVDLQKTEELKGLALLGVDLVDTAERCQLMRCPD